MEIKKQIYNWLAVINEKEILPDGIIAFNFGLFQNSEGYYSVYLIGSKIYDANDDDWAVEEDYRPQPRYLHLKNILQGDMDIQQFSNKMCEIIKSYIASDAFPASILKNAQAITTGFDSGDLIKIL